MSVNNSYPELPEEKYRKTTVEMGEVINYIKSLKITKEIKISVYVVFRNESGNGKSGINNNYCGIQADVGRWPEYLNNQVTGTVIKRDRMTGKERRFLCFTSFAANIDFLVDRIVARGLYVGGMLNKIALMDINNSADWITGYWRSWVTGNANATTPTDERAGLKSIYAQGDRIF